MDKKEAHKIIHEGVLELNGLEIPCYVLEDGTRVLSGRNMQTALKMVDEVEDGKQVAGTRLNRYLEQKSLKPFIYNDKTEDHFEPIECYRGNQKINGYEATVLADICDAFLQARKEIHLSPRQSIIAEQCEILMRSFAKVGIIALVDEATGYQYDRERQELQKILKQYISEELLPWQKRFPDEFYKEIFRLNDWGYFMSGNINIQNRPGVIGHWTKRYVYSILPSGVLEALQDITPKTAGGNRKHRFHQRLTKEEGIEQLQKILVSVITLMSVSDSWKDFEKIWNKKYGQQELTFQEQKDLIEPKPKSPVGFDAKLKTALEYDPKGKGDD
ncbi:MAG: hypothetical protein BalsKO_07380 [Balneolaceae bacterium]